MSERVEEVILSNLVNDEEFCRKSIPFLKREYFSDRIDQIVFEDIENFFQKYNKAPTIQVLKLHLEDRTDLKQSEYDKSASIIENLTEKEINKQWIMERTEQFCKDQSLYNAIMESISILDGKNTKFNKEAIPSMLQEALSISFDKTVGHDYFNDAERRFDFYHLKEERIPFDIDMFNKITKGGLPRKTLSCILAGTNVGKSFFMCHHAAACIKAGHNVLYITLEMAEERIAERIDCNLFDVTIDQLVRMRKADFESKINGLRGMSNGKLVIKEYPTASAHAGHFRNLLDELKAKKNFEPDIVLIDYLNICSSQKYKAGNNYNSYFAIKSIAEELRGLAVEYNVPILTATQTNRGGMNNTDVEMTDTSESAGTPMTLDFFFAMIRTEELDEMGQIMIKQLKSRFNDVNYYKRFVIGSDISKFKLYDVDQPTKDVDDVGKTDDDTGSVAAFSPRVSIQELDFS